MSWDDFSMLIDASADFRAQALRESIRNIDAVLITHGHADHIGGIPDIRSYTKGGKKLAFYGSSESLSIIRQSFSYIFDPDTFIGGGIPVISLQEITGETVISGHKVIPVHVSHGGMQGCYGFRIDDTAYIPDMKSMIPEEEQKLDGIKTLILNCLREQPEHSTHMVLRQSMELARRLAPERCYFVHMCHDIHFEIDGRKLDPWMGFAYDGLRIKV